MSPTVVLYEGRLRAVVGASGGPLIVSSVFQTLARCVQLLQRTTSSLCFPRMLFQNDTGLRCIVLAAHAFVRKACLGFRTCGSAFKMPG